MRKVSHHPCRVDTQSDRNRVRSLLIEAFFGFYCPLAVGRFYHAGISFGMTLQQNKHCSQEDRLSFKQQWLA